MSRSSLPLITSHSMRRKVTASSAARRVSKICLTCSMPPSMILRTSSSISRAVSSLWAREWERSPPAAARKGDRGFWRYVTRPNRLMP